jgi:putative DNA primase/helicase
MDKLSDDELERRIGADKSDSRSSAERAAEDWLSAFAKKSQEALAARDAEKQISPKPDEKALVEVLARKDHTEYDRVRGEVAETLGIRVGTLDDKVEAIRKKRAALDDDALPHWKVDPWPEPVDGAELLNSIKQVFRRYIVLPKGADIALALWVLHAWTYDAGDISPFLVLVSPTKRCGKTSTLIVLLYLTPRSELSSNITGPALFRYIEQSHPTLLIDEADSFVRDNDELRGILNSGHTKAAAYVRRTVEEGGQHTTRRFSTWTPKAVATIRKLADTLEDRAVTFTLQRKARGAKVERLRRRDNEQFATLRRKAARWAADNFDKLTDPNPEVPGVLNDRAADNWRPLLAIAELAKGAWPKDAILAAATLSGEEDDGAIGVELLRDIKEAFGTDAEIRSADLVAALTADPERPWADWRHGRPLTQKQLATLLKPFCIISTNVTPPGRVQGKGYRRADFEEAWEVYCPVKTPSPDHSGEFSRPSIQRPVESTQVDGFRSVQKASADGSKNGKLSYSHAGLDAWTDKNGGNGAKGCSDQETAPDPLLDISTFSRRCAHCLQPGASLEVALADRPGTASLHRECEGPWLASHNSLSGRQSNG